MSELRHRQEGAVDIWESQRGSFRIWRIAPTVLTSRFQGYLDIELARAFVDYLTSVIGNEGRYTALHDWSALDGYASESRKLITDFTNSNKKRFDRIVIYTESRLVRMGIAVANLVLGSIVEAVGTRAALDALIAQASPDGSAPV